MLELVVGLPLIVIMMWSMGHLFTNTWQKCRFAVADFVLQQEMESTLARMVDHAKIAHTVVIEDNGRTLTLYHCKWASVTDTPDYNSKYKYFKDGGRINRGSATNPLTGNDILANSSVTKFNCSQISNHKKLLKIQLEAISLVSQHEIKLNTIVFLKGLQ